MTDDEHRSRFLDFLFGGYIDRRAEELSRKQTKEALAHFIEERRAEESRLEEERKVTEGRLRLQQRLAEIRRNPYAYDFIGVAVPLRPPDEPRVSRGTAAYLEEWFAK